MYVCLLFQNTLATVTNFNVSMDFVLTIVGNAMEYMMDATMDPTRYIAVCQINKIVLTILIIGAFKAFITIP